jgi:hypothetical protein
MIGTNMDSKYGFYSAEAAKFYGTHLYSTVDGQQVEVTSICRDIHGIDYKWKDKRFVGEVVKWLGKVSSGLSRSI